MKILAVPLFLCAVLALSSAADVSDEPEVQPEVEETFYGAEDGNWTDPADVENELGAQETAPQATNNLLRRSCPAGWSSFNNRCFIYIPRTTTWARAQRNCAALGASLASVHSFQEYHFIQGLITAASHGSPETWIGGSDAQENGIWLWSDGSPFQYSYWCPGEPNNYHDQHCLQMNYGGSKCWDDMWCNHHRPSVCAKRI